MKKGLMKKALLVLLVFAICLPLAVCAEEAEQSNPLALRFDARPLDYEGTWKLSSAYEQEKGVLEVPEDACTVTLEGELLVNQMVDMARYVHANVYQLNGMMTFQKPEEAEYKLKCNWDTFTKVDILGEGKCEQYGANKVRISTKDEELFFSELTGVEVEDMELMKYIGMNEQGQLVIGYSESNVHKKPDAPWLYAYLFDKVVEEK